MTSNDLPSATAEPDFLRDQPHAIVERDGVRYTLLGTAHVSRASIDAVEAAVASGRFDAIAVELDANRHRALTEPDQLAGLDLFRIIREGKVGLIAANLALAAYQRRLAEQLGVQPGAELRAAAVGARERGLPLRLIDRDVGTTLKRAWYALGFWGRAKLMAGLATSLFVDEEVDAGEIEKLKQGDILESTFGEFAEGTPQLYDKVIAERDRYMAARLREDAGDSREVLAVVGAGHLKGLAAHLRDGVEVPARVREELDLLPRPSEIPWFTLVLAAVLVGGFGWGFYHGGFAMGADLVLQWVLITAGFGALGCALSGAHPLSIASAALASPITPLHPAISSGMVSALVEAWLRKPTYEDMLRLRDDTGTVRGWWRNRFARVFVNFFLTSMGTSIGVWVAGANLIHRLG
jgi:pheromone shutdown-related protein TraB